MEIEIDSQLAEKKKIESAAGELLGQMVRAWRSFRHWKRPFACTAAVNSIWSRYPRTIRTRKVGVLKILREQRASSRNLQFASEDTYAMLAAFDARWEAGVPFTMVIAPGGKMLYQQQGELDICAMRRSILANLENNTYVGHPAYWAAP